MEKETGSFTVCEMPAFIPDAVSCTCRRVNHQRFVFTSLCVYMLFFVLLAVVEIVLWNLHLKNEFRIELIDITLFKPTSIWIGEMFQSQP